MPDATALIGSWRMIPCPANALAGLGAWVYLQQPMKRIFDMDDRARLPWRFFGATLSVLARA